MIIDYEPKGNKFVIQCAPEENDIVMGLPDRRYRKGSRKWAAPVLRRNVEYMTTRMSNPQMFTPAALKAFNEAREEHKKIGKPTGTQEFPSWYKFKNPPLKHQMAGLKKYFPMDEAGLLFEQGTGKTYTSINLTTAWRMNNEIEAAIVICPSSIKLVWEEELIKHCPIPTQVLAIESGKYKKVDSFIENKDDFQWLVCGIEALSQGNAIDYLERFTASRTCAIIIDESSRIKTPGKTRTDRCLNLGPKVKKRIILSGTAITQGIEDFYTQLGFLNPDITGFSSFFSYRARYCQMTMIDVGVDRFGNPKSVPKIVGYKHEDELLNAAAPYVTRVEKKDLDDLGKIGDKVFTLRLIKMSPTQKKMYADMKHELFIELGDYEYEAATSLEKLLRLQQITSGHYPVDDGEKVTATPIPGNNPKVEELINIVQEVSGKLIVWCQFRSDLERVTDALESKQINYVEFHGSCDESEKKQAVSSFRTNLDTKVFVATRAAAYGLTLIEASTAVYFSQSYSLEEYSQSQDRIHRIGQKSNCNYIYLACEKTIDVDVYKALEAKQSIADLVYSALKGK